MFFLWLLQNWGIQVVYILCGFVVNESAVDTYKKILIINTRIN